MKTRLMLVLMLLSTLLACTKKGSLTLDRTELKLENQAVQLVATVTPEQELVWTSSNNNIVNVYVGLVVPVHNGTAVVTVSTLDGKLSAQCTVTVDGHVKDLSEEGTANCYIIPEGGRYKFKCTRGNKDTQISDVCEAVILWESNFKSSIQKNDMVANISYEDGCVHFQTGKELRGNAVVAVVDNLGNVLWSWHLWFCRGFVPEKLQQTYNDDTVWMDRNLGASSDAITSDFGLMYQWGRKDPFPGPYTNSGWKTPTVPSFPEPSLASKHQSDAGGVTGFAMKNPMVLITSGTSERWCVDHDLTGLWSTTKTQYDPCPLGWHVPAETWKEAAGASTSEKGKVRNYNTGTLGYVADMGSTLAGLQDRMLTYPASGYYTNAGELVKVTEELKVWSCTVINSSSVRTMTANNQSANFSTSSYANGAASVRCVKD